MTVVLAALCLAVPAGAAPAPCGGQPQITDPVGDGHHANTDVVAAWLSEQSGHLQAVIKVSQAVWEPAHEDSTYASLAFLFQVGGVTRYVRAEAPRPPDPVKFDYGTWSGGGSFVSAGPSSGEAVPGAGGTVTIDVPAATGAVPGAVLSQLFVLTWDGVGVEPHWVDRAPGGVSPAESLYGADYRVGPCSGPSGGPGGGAAVSSVQLIARKRIIGGGTVVVRGKVTPAGAGVAVDLTAKARRTVVRKLVTRADGTFSVAIPMSETTQLRAVAGGLASQTHTITVASKCRIKVRRRRGGGVIVRGTVRPKLPGRVLLLRTTSALPSARTKARKGRFTFHLRKPRRGLYQAVFIPSRGRAERSTSNKGAIR
jgi:hypothetical protein